MLDGRVTQHKEEAAGDGEEDKDEDDAITQWGFRSGVDLGWTLYACVPVVT